MGMASEKQNQRNNRNGFTLVEIIVVIVILAILTTVAIPAFIAYIDKGHRAHDLVSLRSLNMGTKLYSLNEQIPMGDVFAEITTNDARQDKLLAGGYIDEKMVPKIKNTNFSWNHPSKLWCLSNSSNPLGKPFKDVLGAMTQYKESENTYGPTWGGDSGTANYTVIGLDPEIWKDTPIDHIYYKPVGSRLEIRPEEGYTFYYDYIGGGSGSMASSLNWVLVYDLKNDVWTYKAQNTGALIDMSNFKVE